MRQSVCKHFLVIAQNSSKSTRPIILTWPDSLCLSTCTENNLAHLRTCINLQDIDYRFQPEHNKINQMACVFSLCVLCVLY